MSSIAPPGHDAGNADDDPRQGPVSHGRPGALQHARIRRRQARVANGVPAGAYDHALVQGTAGEEIVGADLERELHATQCAVLHSLRFLRRGDIDHVVVGPGGITVIDAKNWTGCVSVRDGAPCVGRRRRPKEVGKLQRQVAGVRLALLHARADLRLTDIQGVMCMAPEPDRRRETLPDGLYLSGSTAAADLAARPGSLSAGDITDLRDVLIRYLRQVRRSEIDELLASPVAAVRPTGPNRAPGAVGGTEGRIPAGSVRRSPARQSLPARRQRGSAAGALIALLVAFAAIEMIWVIAHVTRAPSTAPPLVSHLRLTRTSRHLVARFSAPPADAIRLVLITGHHTKRVVVRATGRQQTWVAPGLAREDRTALVTACVLTTVGRCAGPISQTSLTYHNRARARGHARRSS